MIERADRTSARSVAIAGALLTLGLFVSLPSMVAAKPPSHAPAHGYRAKHENKEARKADKLERKHEKFHEKYERQHDRLHEKRNRELRKREAKADRDRERERARLGRNRDLDRDGIPNYRDKDVDGDGRLNRSDRYPRDARRW